MKKIYLTFILILMVFVNAVAQNGYYTGVLNASDGMNWTGPISHTILLANNTITINNLDFSETSVSISDLFTIAIDEIIITPIEYEGFDYSGYKLTRNDNKEISEPIAATISSVYAEIIPKLDTIMLGFDILIEGINIRVCFLGHFSGEYITTGISDTQQTPNIKIYAFDRTIFVENAQGASIFVYDIFGKLLASSKNDVCKVSVPQAGVYIVRAGSEVRKVVVK